MSLQEAWRLYLAGHGNRPSSSPSESDLVELIEKQLLTLDFDDLVREQVTYQLALDAAQTLPSNRQLYEHEQCLRGRIRGVWEGSPLGRIRERHIRGIIDQFGDIVFDRRLATAERGLPQQQGYHRDPYLFFASYHEDGPATDVGNWAGLRAQICRGLDALWKPWSSKAKSRTQGPGSRPGRHSQARPRRSAIGSAQDKRALQKTSLVDLPIEILLQINREHLLEQDLESVVVKYITTRLDNRAAILRAHEQLDQRFGNANRRHEENDAVFWNKIGELAGLATASRALFHQLHGDVVAMVDELITANQGKALGWRAYYDRLHDDDHIRGTSWSITPRWDTFWTKQCSLMQAPKSMLGTKPVQSFQKWSRPPTQKPVIAGCDCRLTSLPQAVLDRIIDSYLGLLLFDYMDYTAGEIWRDTIAIGSKSRSIDNWVLSMLFWNSVWKSATLRLANRMFNLRLQEALPNKVISCMPDCEFRLQCAELAPDNEPAEASSSRTRQLSDLPWLLMWHEITPFTLNQAIYRHRRTWMLPDETSEEETSESQFLPMVAQTHAVIAGRMWKPCKDWKEALSSRRTPSTYDYS